ncbi:hypothetical protein RJ640_029541 [Escallonia rubra]|uniref:Uncharacterized protein n=1 Tax=Escallonia rubra TaxID=112253 RepID=A0AA88QK30_9ASTE|nr:hypothetical protein RJ640_029541 [Escallonia rubra]
MEDTPDPGFGSAVFAPPALVSLSAISPTFSPSPRRLSSHFTPPNRPLSTVRQLAWVSLQGRLVGAEDASSASAIGGGLTPEEAVAWELFSPIHRVLIVAVIAVAAANSNKNKQIYRLTKSVEYRYFAFIPFNATKWQNLCLCLQDQVLSSMQEKLENLCEQVNYFRDQSETVVGMSFTKNDDIGCGCRLCDHHQPASNSFLADAAAKTSNNEMLKYNNPLMNEAEPEERRMSDLSDWAPSISSSIDMQLSTLDIEYSIYSLQKECQEKDAAIQELSAFLQSSEVVGPKRVAELEDVIRRKNMIIEKLKKDIVVLEQKVIHLTRLRRPSFSKSSSSLAQLPVMANNLLYDMDSTTSPSSSDSDCSPNSRPYASAARSQEVPAQSSGFAPKADQNPRQAESSNLLVKSTERLQKSRPVIPLKEKSMNQRPDSHSLSRPKHFLSAGGNFNIRKRSVSRSKDVALQKRWA